MSRTRFIRVKSCHSCHFCGIPGNPLVEIPQYRCFKSGDVIEDPDVIPDFCLLPEWPSVTREEKKILLDGIDMGISEYTPIAEYKCPGKILKEKLKVVIDSLEVSNAD